MEGNRPTNVLLAEVLTPRLLGIARRALRAQRLHPGDDLGHRLVRPVGRRARQGAGVADHPRARERHRAAARPRLVDQRADPPLPRAQETQDRGSVHMTTDTPMQLGMIGLGRMGANLVRRLMRDGHRCVVYDVNAEAVDALEGEGATGRDLASRTSSPSSRRHARSGSCCRRRSSQPTLDQLGRLLDADDIVIDGGNSYYRDDIARAKRACGQGHPLRRLRHERRGLGPRARLLPDDRRRGRPSSTHLDPIFKTIAPGESQRRADAGPDAHRRHRPARLPALRAERRRALREDGPQRDRVRDDGRDRRGPQHHQARRRRQDSPARSTPRRRRCATPRPTSTTSTSPRWPRSGGAARSSARGSST